MDAVQFLINPSLAGGARRMLITNESCVVRKNKFGIISLCPKELGTFHLEASL